MSINCQCSICGNPISFTGEMNQCPVCYVLLCEKDNKNGLCERHFLELDSKDQIVLEQIEQSNQNLKRKMKIRDIFSMVLCIFTIMISIFILMSKQIDLTNPVHMIFVVMISMVIVLILVISMFIVMKDATKTKQLKEDKRQKVQNILKNYKITE
jgi:uncharacterized membrane protein